MRKLLKIFAPIAHQHCAIEFGIAADIVIISGIERRAVRLIPEFFRAKETTLENGAWVAVFRPVSKPLTSLQNQNVRT